MADDREGVHHLLRVFRDRAGLTQVQLAKKTGLSVDEVSKLERGKHPFPYHDTVSRLAAALALSEEQRCQLEAAARRPGRPRPLAPRAV